ncbi:MAG TPA: hypothetical protein VFZ86_12160 [Thermoleophilia bacterium]|nr:hypothetical protein [Thermoleophilia bacterium]
MRNALILLAVVALLILAMGALNNGTAFDVDYVAGTVSAVSLFWVSAVIAALVFVVGLAAAWFAKSAVAGSRRKLEAELQSTYERLREAEALVARPAPAPEPAPVAAVVPAEVAEAETVVAAEEATVVAGADETAPAREDVTLIAGEEATVVAGEEATVVADERGTDVASDAPGEPGEQTAVTMAGATPAGEAGAPDGDAGADGADETRAAESPAEDAAAGEGEAGRTGS